MLGLFHLALLANFVSPIGRMLLMAHLGAFLLWQPLVANSRRLGALAFVLLLCAVGGFQLWLSWISLAAWSSLLAALIAARALPRGGLREHLAALLGFAYLVIVIVAWLVPRGLPTYDAALPLFSEFASIAGCVLIPLVWILDRSPRRQAEPDPVIVVVVLLALGVLVLTALASMFLNRVAYPWALLHAVVAVAGALALAGWLWYPRGGFSGFGLLLSRRIFASGMSLEEWLQYVATLARRATSGEQFMHEAAQRLLGVPNISGLTWEGGRPSFSGRSGDLSQAVVCFEHAGLRVTIGSAYPVDAPTLWRWDLMVLILAEFLRGREQAEELSEVGYLRAIHETGARLTHDVKNELQSLETLLWAVEQGYARDPEGARELLRRQLPALVGRIRMTLDCLRHPDEPDHDEHLAAGAWWQRLRHRQAGAKVEFWKFEGDLDPIVPAALLDRFVDNCILNATEKRAAQPSIQIEIRARCVDKTCCVEVRDTGTAIPSPITERLFRRPVQSNNGLGVGLLQVARQAEAASWKLGLSENRDGAVAFQIIGAAESAPSPT